MLVIGSNLARAFGLVGALSIIRFRTAVKDPKDISFIFLALILGVAVGTQNYHIALTSTAFILTLIYILDQLNYGSYIDNKYFLSIDVDRIKFNENDIKPILDRYTKSYPLKQYEQFIQ